METQINEHILIFDMRPLFEFAGVLYQPVRVPFAIAWPALPWERALHTVTCGFVWFDAWFRSRWLPYKLLQLHGTKRGLHEALMTQEPRDSGCLGKCHGCLPMDLAFVVTHWSSIVVGFLIFIFGFVFYKCTFSFRDHSRSSTSPNLQKIIWTRCVSRWLLYIIYVWHICQQA